MIRSSALLAILDEADSPAHDGAAHVLFVVIPTPGFDNSVTGAAPHDARKWLKEHGLLPLMREFGEHRTMVFLPVEKIERVEVIWS